MVVDPFEWSPSTSTINADASSSIDVASALPNVNGQGLDVLCAQWIAANMSTVSTSSTLNYVSHRPSHFLGKFLLINIKF